MGQEESIKVRFSEGFDHQTRRIDRMTNSNLDCKLPFLLFLHIYGHQNENVGMETN